MKVISKYGSESKFARKLVAAILFGLIFTNSHAQAAELTSGEFTSHIAQALRNSPAKPTVIVEDDLTLSISSDDDAKHTGYLDNSFHRYLADPSELPSITQSYVDTFNEIIATEFEPSIEAIIPIIRSKEWVEPDASNDPNLPLPIFDRLNSKLVVVYVFDTPTHIKFLTSDDLEQLSLGSADLLPIAIENLTRTTPKPTLEHLESITLVSVEGDFDTSVLLLSEFWNKIQKDAAGPIVVAVPSRDEMAFTTANNIEGLGYLRRASGALWSESAYPVSPELFVYREGKFIHFDE